MSCNPPNGDYSRTCTASKDGFVYWDVNTCKYQTQLCNTEGGYGCESGNCVKPTPTTPSKAPMLVLIAIVAMYLILKGK